MRKSAAYLAIVLLTLLLSCNNNQDCCLPIGDLDNLLGRWQVYERGFSPGAGYIIEEVPAEPVQTMTFEADNRFASNYSGLEEYSYFNILDDSSGENILALYKNKSDFNNNQDTDNLEHSYIINYDEGNLKLYFRYCIEGCHIGITKLE
jgi:hypothetical protein